ncbi:MAG: hypothetical protein FJ027_05110 [Candidatus Rokubacteria bacterium]|nr:hypothetical protein [Candidatus Rokubacteria bacterium]
MPPAHALFALLVVLVGCATPRAAHPVWSGPVCGVDLRPVVTAHDADLRRVFDLVAAVARPDLPRARYTDVPAVKLEVVAVERPWRERHHVAGVCRRGSVALVVVNAAALPELLRHGAVPLATVLGHELAHVTLDHEATGERVPAFELEADELGMYYAQRAGFPCRSVVGSSYDTDAARMWPDPAKYRAAVAAACAGAMRGVRPAGRFSR